MTVQSSERKDADVNCDFGIGEREGDCGVN
jgi:hypothetical protein